MDGQPQRQATVRNFFYIVFLNLFSLLTKQHQQRSWTTAATLIATSAGDGEVLFQKFVPLNLLFLFLGMYYKKTPTTSVNDIHNLDYHENGRFF
jgi:hypothetical protein